MRRSGAGYVLVALLCVSLALMIVETNRPWLVGARAIVATVVAPIYIVAEAPYQFGGWAGEELSSRRELMDRNAELERRLLELSHASQQYLALRQENARLRELLGSGARLSADVVVAEIVGVLPGPTRHEVVIDKGKNSGVTVGLAVVDEQGLLGQIIEVGSLTSRVLLLTDSAHAVPVYVARTNLRSVAAGTGLADQLQLEHVADSADVREGDVLISSGLGGRFPSGYPVGVVSAVEREVGASFAAVYVRPSAAIARSRHVLVLFRVEASDGAGAAVTPPTAGRATPGGGR
ncbi:MAG: rod shape-determining protein MreC [Pseudomonadota bacterium]